MRIVGSRSPTMVLRELQGQNHIQILSCSSILIIPSNRNSFVPPALQKTVRKMPPTANTGLALRSYMYEEVPWPRLTITINNQTGEEIEALVESTTRTKPRKYRIEKEMNTKHWTSEIRLQKNTVRSGRCIDHLYRDST